MDYTITSQFHDKKGCFIYVVRLSDRVDRESFSLLSDLARSHKGYYSSFKGVNGFVFKTEEQAEDFCKDTMTVLDKLKEPSVSPSSNAPSKKESSIQLNPTSAGMELHKALRAIIQTEGDAIITELRIVNILDDFKAYSDMPTAKYILRALISDGYAQKLLQIGKWDNDAINLASRFAATTGFMPDVVNVLFKSFAYGLRWIEKWELSSETPTPSLNPQSPPKLKPVGPRSNGWTKKMDEDETEEFLHSIVDYDEEGANKYKVSIENLHFIVDDEEDIFISCEIRKKYRKEYIVNLMFALYDSKGRLRYASDSNDKCIGYIDSSDRGLKPATCYFTEVKASEIGKIKLYWQSPDFY